MVLGPETAQADFYKLSQANYRHHAPFQRIIDITKIDYPRLQAAIFHVTNSRRIKHRLRAVKFHRLLERAARGHAKRMAAGGFYSHSDPDGTRRTPTKRARRQGVTNPKIAENIYQFHGLTQNGKPVYRKPGKGKYSHVPNGPDVPMHTYLSFADAIVDGWMKSPGHRKNILNAKALELGVGAEFFWKGNWPYFMAVQNFQFFYPARTR